MMMHYYIPKRAVTRKAHIVIKHEAIAFAHPQVTHPPFTVYSDCLHPGVNIAHRWKLKVGIEPVVDKVFYVTFIKGF